MTLPLATAYAQDHPLAEADPANRKAAREETPAAEAFAWLANPNAAPTLARLSFAEWLGLQPQWTGPLPDDEDEEDGPTGLDRAYTQYRREMLTDFLGLADTDAPRTPKQ